jgi:2-desacetyl-2-hydroxyethyl bacteriochlorophyllide A dehydrogenase
MKAVIFSEPNKVTITDVDEPCVGDNDVLIQVKSSGICHTDYEILRGNYGSNSFPLIPGHEFAGMIAKVGSNVKDFKVGDRVVVDPNIGCDHCQACLRGWVHLCENLGAYGVSTDGGFAEYCSVASARVHKIGDIPYQRAALAEPIGCVLNALGSVNADWMDNALIFGAGPMGILMGLTLKHLGVNDITFCDITESRLVLAESFGFEAIISGGDDLQKWKHCADLVIEATGVVDVAAKLPDYIVNGGKGLFFGVCSSDVQIEVSPFEIFRRQLTLAGTHSLNRNIPQALGVISVLGSKLDAIVSHEVNLPEIREIFSGTMPKHSLKVQWKN